MKVPKLDNSTSSSAPVAGTTKAATAETPNATEPIRLASGIHHDRLLGCHEPHPCDTSNQAKALATRKHTDPTASGRHTCWRDACALRSVVMAWPVLTLK